MQAPAAAVDPIIIVRFSWVVDDVHGGAVLAAGAMDLHDFAKPPRSCTTFVCTTLVHKHERPKIPNGSDA